MSVISKRKGGREMTIADVLDKWANENAWKESDEDKFVTFQSTKLDDLKSRLAEFVRQITTKHFNDSYVDKRRCILLIERELIGDSGTNESKPEDISKSEFSLALAKVCKKKLKPEGKG